MRPALYPILFGTNYSAEAKALFAAMTTPPTSVRKSLIDITIKSLKTSGVWALLDVLYVIAAADSQSSLLNWVSPSTFAAIAVNSPTFVADRGYTGNGTSSRLRTQYTPSTNGVNYVQDNASAWVWSLTSSQSAIRDIGNVTSPSAFIIIRNTSDQINVSINDGTGSLKSNTNSVGLFGAQRPSSSVKRAWGNGVQIGTDMAVASTGLPAQEQWIGGADSTQFSPRQEALAAWGASLSGKESAFYGAMLAYMQAVGAA